MQTLVFTDMEDSSVWWHDLDSEFLPVLQRHDALLLATASHCDGTPIQSTGDGFFLMFEKPENAVRFAEKTLRALQSEPWNVLHPKVEQLRVRIGIHSGAPSVYPTEDGKQDYRGHDVGKTARVMDTAYGGTAVLSGEAYDRLHADFPDAPSLVSRYVDWNVHELKGVGKTRLWQPVREGLEWEYGRIPREKQQKTKRQSVRMPNSNFTGREAELLALHRQFRSGTPMARQQVIVGLGGIGKTELALAYCERRFAEYDAVFWVRADSETSIVSGFLNIARKLELPVAEESGSDEVLREVQNCLANERDYLLVLDDVERFEDVEAMLPRGARGHLLVTTRVHATGDWDTDTPVVLEPLSLAESTTEWARHEPRSVTFGPDGNLYASVFSPPQIIRFEAETGAYLGVFASYPSLERPVGITFGPDDNLYVACYLRSCVFRFHGKTGAFLDRFVRARSGNLKYPTYLKFGPAERPGP